MAAYNSSSAYDLSSIGHPQQKPKPELKVVKAKRSLGASLLNFRTFSAAAVVVGMLTMMLYSQVELTEITDEINSLTTQLEELEGENTRLRSDLESTMSLRTIGEQAKNELGMNRRDKYQTVYIHMEAEDRAELTENSPDPALGQRIESAVTGAVEDVQEYLQGQQNID